MEWWTWVLIGVLVAAVVAIIWIGSRTRRERLRATFGPEYERTVEAAESRRDAEGDLRGRLKRHRSLELRPLEPDVAAGYAEEWTSIQTRFVDAPQDACDEAEHLLDRVLRDRGYPVEEDFDTQADLVSVDHPNLTGDYRRAHETLHDTGNGAHSLEDLRDVFVIYRGLFSDLLDGHEAIPRPEHDVTPPQRHDVTPPQRVEHRYEDAERT